MAKGEEGEILEEKIGLQEKQAAADALSVRSFFDVIRQPVLSSVPGTYTIVGDVESARPWVDGSRLICYFVTLVEKAGRQTYNLQAKVPAEVMKKAEMEAIRPNTKLLISGRVVFSRDNLSIDASCCEDIGLARLYRIIEGWRVKYKALIERPKKPLPAVCGTIAVISNNSAQGLADFRRHLRYGNASLRSTTMQGEKVAEKIAAAIREINARNGINVICIVRGGGATFSALFEYNHPVLLEAIGESSIPVLCAIGHESDRLLCDDVCDQRFSTPTHLAKFLSDRCDNAL